MKNVGIGLIGFGAWGSHHARVIAAGAATRLVAISDCEPLRREEAATAYPEIPVYADYREMLKSTNLDAVSVVVPSHLHHAVSRAVLEAGKHLYLEKPMALTIDDCRDLVQLAGERKVQLSITHQFRFSSLWGKIKQMLDDGAIGDLQYALIELWRNPYRLGVDGWRYDIQRVGDWILEEPIHFFDLARWYFAAVGEPTSVYARANSHDPRRPALQDNFAATVNFPGGRFAVIAQTLAAFEHHQVVKLTGTDGALWATWGGANDRTFHPTFSLKHFDGQTIHDIPVEGKPGEVYELADAIEDFAEAICMNRSPRVSGEDGLKSVYLCLKAQESVARQSVVAL